MKKNENMNNGHTKINLKAKLRKNIRGVAVLIIISIIISFVRYYTVFDIHIAQYTLIIYLSLRVIFSGNHFNKSEDYIVNQFLNNSTTPPYSSPLTN